MKFRLIEDYKPEYQSYTFDDLLDGMNGNVSEEDIDKFIKFYNKVAKLLRRKPEDILAFRSEDELFELLPFESEKVKIVGDDVLLKTYIKQNNMKSIFAIEQFINGNYWYYVRDDKDFFNCFTDDWDKYQNSVQQFNEGKTEHTETNSNCWASTIAVPYSSKDNKKKIFYIPKPMKVDVDSTGAIIAPDSWMQEWEDDDDLV